MNAEQKQRAKDALTNWIADEMAALLQELIDAPEPEPVAHAVILPNGMTRIWFSDKERGEQWRKKEGIKQELTTLYTSPPANNQSEQPLEMVNAPAPSVPDSKTLQFLTDVLTAAGLLRHGKKDAGLATRIADESCRIRQQLFTQPEQPADLVRDAERWLSQRDLELLVTFGMQADDCDADGHTLSKEQTRRLCELGVLRNVGFGRSEMTAFGCVLFDQHWEQSRSLPLRTHAEYAALAAEKGGAE